MIELPQWLVVVGALASVLFGGGGFAAFVFAAMKARPQRLKIQIDAEKVKVDKDQLIITGSVEVAGKLLAQYTEILDVAKQLREELELARKEIELIRREKDDCMAKLKIKA